MKKQRWISVVLVMILTISALGTVKTYGKNISEGNICGKNASEVTCKSEAKKTGLSAKKLYLVAGKGSVTLELSGTKAKSFKSSDTEIATVSSAGKVSGKKAGKATITVTGDDGKTYVCKVKVVKNSGKYPAVYAAYADIIKSKEAKLRVIYHDWQETDKVQMKRNIALEDIWGDSTPELLVVEEGGKEEYVSEWNVLTIYTFRDGRTKKLYSRELTMLEDGMYYYDYSVYRTKNEKNAYIYMRMSVEDSFEGSWSKLSSKGKVKDTLVYRYDAGYENEFFDNFVEYFYDKKGNRITKDEYESFAGKVRNKNSKVLYSSYYAYDEPDGCMSYEAAIRKLTGKKLKTYTDGQLCAAALKYYKKVYGQEPPLAEVDGENGNTVTIRLYETANGHTSTWEWFYVDRKTGKGTSMFSGNVDLAGMIEF